MGDVFVSYAREDRGRVLPLVRALERAGLSVWWDPQIRPGAGFDDEIQAALDAARCVLVIWSRSSIGSQWVREEAREGLRRDMLVPVCIDPVEPPLGFRSRQNLELFGSDHEALVAAVRHAITRASPQADSADTLAGSAPAERIDGPRGLTAVRIAAIGSLLLVAVLLVLAVAPGTLAPEKGAGEATDEPRSPAATDDSPATIAVLPFVNIGGDPEQEIFSDGLSEELLNLLARIPELRVTSRTSAFSFKDKEITIPEVGRILGVGHVLEGSVRRSGDTIRVSAQLVETETDAQVWSSAWNRGLEDIFAIQEEIAGAVASALELELIGPAPEVLETTPAAYELFLRASFLMDQRLARSFREAEAINERVLQTDPTYAPAWAQRALIFYSGIAFQAYESAEVAPRIRDAARTAIRLQSDNALAHATLAYLAMDIDYDYDAAERHLESALKFGSNDPRILLAAAEFHQRQGELAQAVGYYEQANEIDPLGTLLDQGATAFFYAGQEQKALELLRRRVERNPYAGYLHRTLAIALLETGDVDSALETIAEETADGHRYSALALIYETIGDRERSSQALEKAVAAGRRWTWEITEVHAYRGELDEAFKWINRAIERRDRGLRHVMYSPYIDNMRGDPRFEDVLIRLGLQRDA